MPILSNAVVDGTPCAELDDGAKRAFIKAPIAEQKQGLAELKAEDDRLKAAARSERTEKLAQIQQMIADHKAENHLND